MEGYVLFIFFLFLEGGICSIYFFLFLEGGICSIFFIFNFIPLILYTLLNFSVS